MGKPDKAVSLILRIVCRLLRDRRARLGAMISQSKVGFSFRFWSPSGDGYPSFRDLFRFTSPDYAARGALASGQQNCQVAGHAACIARVRALVVGTEKKSFFEVPVVPFV
jgi:hypothetical protein